MLPSGQLTQEEQPKLRLVPYKQRGFDFTQDWFLNHVALWSEHILPALKDRPVTCLEIGSYEGLSATWMSENIMGHQDSTLHCCDIWPNAGIKARFMHNINTAGHGVQVTAHHGKAFETVRRLGAQGLMCDFIYIDGDHQAKAALQDAAMCWPMLKRGGIMAFDDYPWVFPEDFPGREGKIPPQPGIDAFLLCWEGEYELLVKGWQVIVRKL
jgi:hypothetical protein